MIALIINRNCSRSEKLKQARLPSRLIAVLKNYLKKQCGYATHLARLDKRMVVFILSATAGRLPSAGEICSEW